MLWTGLLLLLRNPQQSFLAHDEGYYAQQARWILENQDWLTVGWWGDIFYDRTLALQILIATSYRLFGFSETAARLPSMLACLGAVLLTWRLGERFSHKWVGWWGSAILAVIPVWMQASQMASQDILLVCIELLGIWALITAESHRGAGRVIWGVVAGITVGLGFFVKSFMILLPVLALLPYLVLEHRRHRHLNNPGLYLGLILGALPMAIWLGLSMARYGSAPVEQLFGKLLALSKEDGVFDFPSTPFFYVWNIPANSFPWAFFAIAGGFLAFRDSVLTRKWLWLGYPLLLLAMLMAFDTRTWYYPLQLYPFMALLSALALNHLAQRYLSSQPWQRQLPIRLSAAVGVLGFILLLAGGLLLLAPLPDLPSSVRVYGWIGMGGLGWLIPLWVVQRDREQPWRKDQALLWRMGWLLGPWLAISAVFLTGLWGNYSPDIKTALATPPINTVLTQNRVHFVRPTADPVPVLLTVYTPQLGEKLTGVQALAAGQYAWVPVSADFPIPPTHQWVGQVRDWQLVKAP